MECLNAVIQLEPDAFTSEQYNTELIWMRNYKLRKIPEYQNIKTLRKRRKSAEKAGKFRAKRLYQEPKQPIITANGAQPVLNCVLFIIGLMVLVGIFAGGSEDVSNDMYDESRTLKRR